MDYLLRNRNILIYILIAFVIGLCIGRYTKNPTFIRNKVLRESGYKYINPILLCNTDNQQEYNHYIDLSNKLNEYVNDNNDNTISIYYLNLVSGAWASVNENQTYSPASMLKVPTVVDALKFSENNPSVLNKELYFDGSFDNNKNEDFKPEKYIEAGKYYTVNELLSYIIKYSDNNALTLLHKAIGTKTLQEIYSDLNITIPENTLDFMNARTYSLFLRILYNGTYLNRENSEKVLKLLIDSNYSPGIRSEIPKETETAIKFGERRIIDTKGNLIKKELHECGIIYKENDPFILCVMTSGNDFESLQKNIKDVTKIVYSNTQKN